MNNPENQQENYIRTVRTTLKLSLEEMAELLGTSKPNVVRLEEKSDEELAGLEKRSALVATASQLAAFVEQAQNNNPDAIDFINKLYEKLLEKNASEKKKRERELRRWVPHVGAVVGNGLIGGLLGALAAPALGAILGGGAVVAAARAATAAAGTAAAVAAVMDAMKENDEKPQTDGNGT